MNQIKLLKEEQNKNKNNLKLLKSFVKEYKKELDRLGRDCDFNFDDIESIKDFSFQFYSDTLARMPKDKKVIEKLDIAAYASMMENEEHITFDEYKKIKKDYKLNSIDKYFDNEKIANKKEIFLNEIRKSLKEQEKENFKAKQKL